MRDLPSCFGESGVQIADSSSSPSSSAAVVAGKKGKNVVASLYRADLAGRPYVITITWSKNLMGQSLAVAIGDFSNSNHSCLFEVDIKPWIFAKRKGSKTVEINKTCNAEIYWDFSVAKFGSGPEPLEGFFVAVTFDLQMVVLVGDLIEEAFRKSCANSLGPSKSLLFAKRQHLFGKKIYSTRAQFCDNGKSHEVVIQCDELCLEIRIDKMRVVQVKRLDWKFRGNQTILVDGVPVELYWDVHNWLFGGLSGNAAVFMFQSCSSAEKLFLRDDQLKGLGFSLIIYAWKNE